MPHKDPADWMEMALAQARLAAASGEVPVGAVVVRHGEVIATGRNAPVDSHDPTAHAEVVALRAAAQAVGNYRLRDCELYVTLEPCAMCSGAMLHARLKRVVFGAFDAKTGAAGSVVNLFALPQLNHQTDLQGGVLAAASTVLLQDFFKQRRAEQREASKISHPLRDDALRTPDNAFNGLPEYPWQPNYISDLPVLDGLRLHYLDEGKLPAGSAPQLTYLCLHGNPAWSYLYRQMIPVFLQAGHRVVAPDLIGFGKSDKPKKDRFHSFDRHRQILLEFVDRLDLHNVVLVVQDWGGILGLTLPVAAPQRYRGLLVMDTHLACGDTPLGCAAYTAPFPDRGYRAATRAFQAMVPESIELIDSDGRSSRDFWQYRWTGQTLMVMGTPDPVPGLPGMRELQAYIRGCGAPLLLEASFPADASHFVRAQGQTIAQHAVRFFQP